MWIDLLNHWGSQACKRSHIAHHPAEGLPHRTFRLCKDFRSSTPWRLNQEMVHIYIYVCNKVRSTACACLHSRIIATCGKLPRSHLNTSQHIFWDLPLSNHVKSHQIFSSQITPFGLQTCNSTTIAMAPIVTVAEIKICAHYRVPVTNLAQQGYLQAFTPFKLPCWKALMLELRISWKSTAQMSHWKAFVHRLQMI